MLPRLAITPVAAQFRVDQRPAGQRHDEAGVPDAHEPHIHPNTAIAAVYYVAAGAARACAIDLYDPRIAAEYFDPGIRLAAEGDRMRLHCAPGELLLFPGWVRHGVPRYDDGGIRVSMSWNLYFAVQANS